MHTVATAQADYNAICKQLRTAGQTGRERGILNANLAKAKVRLKDSYKQQPTPTTLTPSKSCIKTLVDKETPAILSMAVYRGLEEQ
jgi:hypothetical protein